MSENMLCRWNTISPDILVCKTSLPNSKWVKNIIIFWGIKMSWWKEKTTERKKNFNNKKKCKTPGCNSTASAKGLCRNCYSRQYYHKKKNKGGNEDA